MVCSKRYENSALGDGAEGLAVAKAIENISMGRAGYGNLLDLMSMAACVGRPSTGLQALDCKLLMKGCLITV
ncbi:MAG: hypothetical protein EA001_15120 [Oscillatoriales cyanobacterium]|nr:MAG: hypothetical protein EA001_15120 [Oscillatoriales cyanobacterium]